MSVLKLKCLDQVLTLTNTPVIASGGINENTLEVDFCSRWDGFVKTAIFYKEEDKVYNVLMVNDTCNIPNEITMSDGTFYFGIFGVNGVNRNTSEIKTYKIVKGSFIEGQEPQEPTPDIYTQIMDLHSQIIEKYNSIFADINNIVTDSVLRGVVNQNDVNQVVQFWFGTQEEYNAIKDKKDTVVYHITDYEEPVPKAANASNVTDTIHMMDLYSIFESDDGDNLYPIVQNATTAVNAENLRTTDIEIVDNIAHITHAGLYTVDAGVGGSSDSVRGSFLLSISDLSILSIESASVNFLSSIGNASISYLNVYYTNKMIKAQSNDGTPNLISCKLLIKY